MLNRMALNRMSMVGSSVGGMVVVCLHDYVMGIHDCVMCVCV